ncbi:restriction endonuclease subunit S, partial [Methylomonas koyamae]|uniref:restriction endonuclease subunit S n=1 Tax=Methylomonas koyamae TaxID=702114 RepID=UPI000A6CDFB5
FIDHYSMTNLRRDGIYLKLDDLKYVDVKSDSADGKRTALVNGDILISITAELGKIGWIPENFGEAFINQHTALVRINQNKADSKFIAYLLSSKKMNAVINQLNDAGAKAGLNLPTIKALPLLLPPFKEQQKIAQILSTWDKAIEKMEAMIAAKQKRKKALMQQLLTDKKRFAGFQGEWKECKIGKISNTVTSGSRDWAQFYSETGSKFIRMTNLRRDGIYLNLYDLKYVDVKSDSADGKRTALTGGDILISITAELGKIGWIPEGFGEAYINQHTALIRINNKKADSKFIAYLLSSEKMNAVITQFNDAGAKAGLNLLTIKSLPIVLPPLPEQQKIASVLTAADTEIETHQKQLSALKQQKKGLMQQLLTGKKRVKVDGHV